MQICCIGKKKQKEVETSCIASRVRKKLGKVTKDQISGPLHLEDQEESVSAATSKYLGALNVV